MLVRSVSGEQFGLRPHHLLGLGAIGSFVGVAVAISIKAIAFLHQTDAICGNASFPTPV